MLPSNAWPRQATAVLSVLLTTSPVYRRVWTLVHQFHITRTHRQGQASRLGFTPRGRGAFRNW